MSLRVSIAAVLSATALAGQVPSLDLTTVPTKITPQSLVVGDFNHDGKPDLAVTGSADNGAGSVEILLNNGDATFHPAAVINVGEAASRIAAADFNRDGKLDLAVSVGFTGQVSILLGNGDGSFQAPPR
ncbi:MAG: VCBS repeat-containing protein [Ignavibacteriota bacterium]